MKASDVIRKAIVDYYGDANRLIPDERFTAAIESALRDAGLLNEWVKVSERLPETRGYYVGIPKIKPISEYFSRYFFDPSDFNHQVWWKHHVEYWQSIRPPEEE